MKYSRFEDLPVWQAAMKVTEDVFHLTEDKSFNFKGDLRDEQKKRSEAFLDKLKQVQQGCKL